MVNRFAQESSEIVPKRKAGVVELVVFKGGKVTGCMEAYMMFPPGPGRKFEELVRLYRKYMKLKMIFMGFR